MALELLTCTICPKTPKFSDISHLLTHVGSKGHLAHLHKLQVRSHQEQAAIIQLAAYDAWYQAHNLGQLLSERMMQKDAKQAGKRTGGTHGKAVTKKEEAAVDPFLDEAFGNAALEAKPRKRKAEPKRRTSRRHAEDDDSDFSPIRRPRRAKPQAYLPSQVKRSSSVDCNHCPQDDCPAEDDYQFVPPRTPENAKLKGQVWPGMALFDAASDEMKRKRNQKKDGSVLTRMQMTSILIEPTEVTFSPGGTLRRQRHMDNLEDTSSLIEGETPVQQLSGRRRRQPLGPWSANVPRLVKRKPRVATRQKRRAKTVKDGLPLPSLSSTMTTSPSYGLDTSPGYTPTEDENAEFKLTFSKMQKTKKISKFAIFDDNDAALTNPLKRPTNPLFNARQTYTYAASSRQDAWVTPAWLQPQQQPLYYNQLHTTGRGTGLGLSGFPDVGLDKENIAPDVLGTATPSNSQSANPLFWRSTQFDGLGVPDVSEGHHGMSELPFSLAAGLEDPFSGARNPFATAFGSLGADLTLGQLKRTSSDLVSTPSKMRLAPNPLLSAAD